MPNGNEFEHLVRKAIEESPRALFHVRADQCKEFYEEACRIAIKTHGVLQVWSSINEKYREIPEFVRSLRDAQEQMVLVEPSANPHPDPKALAAARFEAIILKQSNESTWIFADMGIADAEASQIARHLPSGYPVETLDLSNNRIGDDGARALAKAVAKANANGHPIEVKGIPNFEEVVKLVETANTTPFREITIRSPEEGRRPCCNFEISPYN